MSKDTVTPTVAGSPATAPTKPLGEVIQIDQALVQKHLGEVVRSTVQDSEACCELNDLWGGITTVNGFP